MKTYRYRLGRFLVPSTSLSHKPPPVDHTFILQVHPSIRYLVKQEKDEQLPSDSAKKAVALFHSFPWQYFCETSKSNFKNSRTSYQTWRQWTTPYQTVRLPRRRARNTSRNQKIIQWPSKIKWNACVNYFDWKNSRRMLKNVTHRKVLAGNM